MYITTDCDTAGHWPIYIMGEDDTLLGRQCLLCGEWEDETTPFPAHAGTSDGP